MAPSVVAQVTAMAAEPCRELGLELVDVVYAKEHGRYILRIFIDKPGGVTIDDCEAFSNSIGRLLDEADPIPNQYYLEVSSPGIDRPLKKVEDFDRFSGSKAAIKLYAPLEGRRSWQGILRGVREGQVVLQVEENEVLLPLSQIAKANLLGDIDI
ncbi:MAG TPA: ribosome maturation factor RimP [Firmicutes bacterium]|nr:ribosome maturation factor RimP [Bacillota bacterium]